MSAMLHNKLGILFDNKKRHPAEVATRMALRQFHDAPHTNGHKPRDVYFHPDERPDETNIAGLTVLTDKHIPLHHIRVTTDELEELEAI